MLRKINNVVIERQPMTESIELMVQLFQLVTVDCYSDREATCAGIKSIG